MNRRGENIGLERSRNINEENEEEVNNVYFFSHHDNDDHHFGIGCRLRQLADLEH